MEPVVLTPLAHESTRLFDSFDFGTESTREIGLGPRVQEKPASGQRVREKSADLFSAVKHVLFIKSVAFDY